MKKKAICSNIDNAVSNSLPNHGKVINAFNPVRPIGFTGPDDRKQSWNELIDVYKVFANGLLEIGHHLSVWLKEIASIRPELTEKVMFHQNAIIRDLNIFTTELLTIKGLHENKQGFIDKPEDLTYCLDVFSQYQIFNERMSTIMRDHITEVTALMAEAKTPPVQASAVEASGG
jgi:hypothetical protein